jgi:hypothetical protein
MRGSVDWQVWWRLTWRYSSSLGAITLSSDTAMVIAV